MLVFGRLYVDHEMAVLNGSGVSRNQLALLIADDICLFDCSINIMFWGSSWGIRELRKFDANSSSASRF
jgi:lipopolysaccharide export system permease protein